jgi:hypothetical protein
LAVNAADFLCACNHARDAINGQVQSESQEAPMLINSRDIKRRFERV